MTESITPAATIYARYSSNRQRDVSIEQQIKVCEAYAERMGIRIVGTYADHAMTGTNDRRPEFQRMIRDAERGEWEYVIIYQLDRFARNRYDSAVYKRQLKLCGVRVLSAMENISDDPTGILMESLLEGLAEYYSKELSVKIRRGMQDNAERGLVTNGQLPLGYRRGSDGRYEIVPEEASIVQEIFDRVERGDSFASIATDLNTRGVHTKRGGPWNKNSFARILRNERYTGIYIYDDIRVEGGVPQIITKEQFGRVALKVRTKPNPSGNPQRKPSAGYMLTGKLFCGHCKSAMVGVSGRGRHGDMHYYYMCKKRRADHSCNKDHGRRDYIEKTVVSALREYVLRDDVIEWVADQAMEYQAEHNDDLELASLNTQLDETKKSIKNIMAAIEAGIITESTKNRLQELEAEQRHLELLISNKPAPGPEITRDHIIAWLETFRDGDADDPNYQQTLIDAFLVAIYLYDDHIRIIFTHSNLSDGIDVPLNISNEVCTDSPQLHHIAANAKPFAAISFYRKQSTAA